MIRRLRAKLHLRAKPDHRITRSDPESVRRAHDDSDRENWKLWKLRTPPTPRR